MIALFEKIYDAEPIVNVISNIREDVQLLQLSVWCEKCFEARHYAGIGKQLLIANDINRVRWAVLGLSQEGICTDSFENLSENRLNGDQSNDTKFNPPLFSLVNTFNYESTCNDFNFNSINFNVAVVQSAPRRPLPSCKLAMIAARAHQQRDHRAG